MSPMSLLRFSILCLCSSSILSILSTRETKELAGVNTSNEALLLSIEGPGRGSMAGLESSKQASSPESVEENL